jgi:hypothetical protein
MWSGIPCVDDPEIKYQKLRLYFNRFALLSIKMWYITLFMVVHALSPSFTLYITKVMLLSCFFTIATTPCPMHLVTVK